jgi:hypothetical protein|nr:MAG TPA: hypothetical protein [Bacteriophage sp.]
MCLIFVYYYILFLCLIFTIIQVSNKEQESEGANMDKQYRLVTESGKILLGGETYSRRGAESWFDDFNGIYEDDETGAEERIYIEEVK